MEKSKPINRKNCLNMQMSYEVTEDYLRTANFFKYSSNLKFETLIDEIKKWTKENCKGKFKIEDWKINNLTYIPNRIAQFEPWSFIDFNDTNFCSYNEISNDSLDKIKYMLLGHVYSFIKENNINIILEEDYNYISSILPINEFNKNEKLIKAKFIFDVCSKPFLYDNKMYKFLYCCNPNGGLEAVSEVIGQKKNRISLVIKPNLVKYNNKLYIEPQFVVRRYIDDLKSQNYLGTQKRAGNNKKNVNHTLFIKKKDRYLTIRITKDNNYNEHNENSYPVKFYYKDYVLAKSLKYIENIDIKMVNKVLQGEIINENILLVQHSSMDNKILTEVGAGLHSNDKLLLNNHIHSCCKGLKQLPVFECIKVDYFFKHKFREKKQINSLAINEGKLFFNKVRLKNDVDEINLYIFIKTDSETNIINYVHDFFKYPSKILNDIDNEDTNLNQLDFNTTKINDKKYVLHLQNKDLILNILEIINDEILSPKFKQSETGVDRAKIIKEVVGDIKKNSMALIELDNIPKKQLDAKAVLSQAFSSIEVVNQFINPDDSLSIMQNKTRASLLDLINDYGFVNANLELGDTAVYSFAFFDLNYNENKSSYIDNEEQVEENNEKKKMISFVIRMDDDVIEFKPLIEEYRNKWFHICEINSVLYKIKIQLSMTLDVRFKTDEEIIEVIEYEISKDKRNKIVIINPSEISQELIVKILMSLDNCSIVQTEISNTEVVQLNKNTNKTGIAKCVYKMYEGHYRSIGEKNIGMKQNSSMYKYDDIKKEYKYRNLFDIKIVKSNMDNDTLALIIHNLRNPLTTKIHLNNDILTDHLASSIKKHM